MRPQTPQQAYIRLDAVLPALAFSHQHRTAVIVRYLANDTNEVASAPWRYHTKAPLRVARGLCATADVKVCAGIFEAEGLATRQGTRRRPASADTALSKPLCDTVRPNGDVVAPGSLSLQRCSAGCAEGPFGYAALVPHDQSVTYVVARHYTTSTLFCTVVSCTHLLGASSSCVVGSQP
jgi:hypothetical protein